jgi:hypothetical protein
VFIVAGLLNTIQVGWLARKIVIRLDGVVGGNVADVLKIDYWVEASYVVL